MRRRAAFARPGSERQINKLKIVILNARYSENLGEGVIAECLEHALRARIPDLTVAHCDLSGRKAYGEQGVNMRSLAHALLPVAPKSVKDTVNLKILTSRTRSQLLPHYDEVVNCAEIAIFGGGLMLVDKDLTTPIKLAAAASIVRSRHIPIAIHAVGVDEDLSETGREIVKEAFHGADLAWVSVRDETSRRRWERHFAGISQQPLTISFEPGLLAAAAYGLSSDQSASRRNRPLVGLCVTSLAALSTGERVARNAASAQALEFYRGAARAMCADNQDVLVFTNGAQDDEAILRRAFSPEFLALFKEGQLRIAPRATTPAELAGLIGKCDCVVSHRVQACILAYAQKIPIVGISLDDHRLKAIFHLIRHPDLLIGSTDAQPPSAEDVAAAARRAIDREIDDDVHAAVIGQVERDLDDLASTLKSAAERSQVDPGAV